jgi:hypothetical protein
MIDYNEFFIWAYQMIKTKWCADKKCKEHLKYDGPTAFNEDCQNCFNRRKES